MKRKKNVLQISVNKSNTVKTIKQILYFYLALHEFLIYFQATFYPPWSASGSGSEWRSMRIQDLVPDPHYNQCGSTSLLLILPSFLKLLDWFGSRKGIWFKNTGLRDSWIRCLRRVRSLKSWLCTKAVLRSNRCCGAALFLAVPFTGLFMISKLKVISRR